jgi:hypothetical protein
MAGRKKQPWAREEIKWTAPERQPLPDPTGLEGTLSPVDLPDPPEPLPHPLRWTSIVIAVASAVLALTNAHAIRGWAYQLPPNEWTAPIVTGAEGWYDTLDAAGLNAPVETMRGWWQAAKEVRFGGDAPEGPAPDSA